MDYGLQYALEEYKAIKSIFKWEEKTIILLLNIKGRNYLRSHNFFDKENEKNLILLTIKSNYYE